MDLSKLSDEELKRLALESGVNVQSTETPDTSLASKAETIGARLARVATADFADELGGLASGLTQKAKDIYADKFYEGLPSKEYNQGRDKLREYFKKTAEANPTLDTATNVIGNIGLAFTPVGAIGKGASVTGAALKAGALGALQGAGESEAETLGGVAKDAAIGGAIAGTLGGVSQKIGKVAESGIGKLKSALTAPVKETVETGIETTAKLTPIDKVKTFAARVMGVTGDDAEAILKNADEIKKLRGTTTQESFINAVKNNSKELAKAHKQSIEVLSPEKTISKESLHSILDDIALKNRDIPFDVAGNPMPAKEVLGLSDVKNQAKESAINKVREVIEKRMEKNPAISPRELKSDINKTLDDMVSYEAKKAGTITPEYENQIKEIRKNFDGILKQNLDYKNIMDKEVAPRTKTMALLGKKFGVTKDINDETAFDMAAKKLDLLQKNQKPNAYKAEERTLNRLDPQFTEQMRLRGLDARNEGGITQGSRNVNLGGITGLITQHALSGGAGAIVGGLGTDSAYGAGIGAIAGGILDKSGRTLGKQLLMSGFGRKAAGDIAKTATVANVPIEAAIRNTATPGVSKILNFQGTKFFDRLQQALTKGGSAYIQEDFILSNDPEYRAIKRGQK